MISEDTPKKMWEALHEKFSQKTEENKATLIEKITSAEQHKGESVAKFVARVEGLQRRLKDGHGEVVSDGIITGILLKGVSSKFEQTIEALRCLENLSLKKVKEKLISTDERMRSSGGKHDDKSANAYTMEHQKGSGSSQKVPDGRNHGKKDTRRCFNCGKVGHIAAKCWHRDQSEKKHENHQKKVSFQDSRGAALATSASVKAGDTTSQSEKILVDTGASHHMCHDRSKFISLQPSSISTVTCGGGEIHQVEGQGTVCIQGSRGKVSLHHVLYVPTLKVHLFSWSAASRRGANLRGGDGILDIVVQCRTVLRGVAKDGLFQVEGKLLKAHDVEPASLHTQGAAHVAATLDVWHKRLGHAGYQAIKQIHNSTLVKNFEVNGDAHVPHDPCGICIEGKQHRFPFPASQSVTHQSLELVHSDVVGKMPCKSIGGSQWALCLMDDYSRYSEVVCLRSKADVAEAMWDVLVRWERQTGHKVKTVRTDGGTEYMGSLKKRFREAGIVHQTSTRYTPQQNGRAERLNRTLLERTRCMLLEAKLPSSFWAEAIATASYLRNLLPTKAGSATPFQMFKGVVPDVSHLRVFGCYAYAHIPSQLQGKFDKRGMKGIMCGYAENKKAWRVMCQKTDGTWQLHISRDVHFIEHIKGREAMLKPIDDSVVFDVDFSEKDPASDDNVQQHPLGGEMVSSQQNVEENVDPVDEIFEDVPDLLEDDDEELEDDIDDEQDEAAEAEDDVPEEPVQQEGQEQEMNQEENNQPRRSRRVTAAPYRYDPAAYVHTATEPLTDEPKTLREVLARPDAETRCGVVAASYEGRAICAMGKGRVRMG